MARRNGGDNFQYGVCTNTDFDGNGNPCPRCASKEVQKIRGSKDFVCEECGEALTKVNGSTPINRKLIAGIIAAIVVLAGAGFGVWQFVLNAPKIEKIKLDKESITLVIGENPNELLKATVEDKDGNEIKNAKVTYKWFTNDESIATVAQGGEVTAVNKGETSITVQIEGNEGLRGTCQVVVKEKPITGQDSTDKEKANSGTGNGNVTSGTRNGKINLGYGTYDGPLSNGKAHGIGGEITVTSTYIIDLKKASGETVTVNRGDKIMNVKMENGRLRQGEIHFADGTRKYISGL